MSSTASKVHQTRSLVRSILRPRIQVLPLRTRDLDLDPDLAVSVCFLVFGLFFSLTVHLDVSAKFKFSREKLSSRGHADV